MTTNTSPEIVAALSKAKRTQDSVEVVVAWAKYQGEVSHLSDRFVVIDTWSFDEDGREYRLPLKEVQSVKVLEGGEDEDSTA